MCYKSGRIAVEVGTGPFLGGDPRPSMRSVSPSRPRDVLGPYRDDNERRLWARETTHMMTMNGSDTDHIESRPAPRYSVRFDSDGTWSAWRGGIPRATGLLTVGEAWDLINREAPARSPPTPPAPRRSWRRAG